MPRLAWNASKRRVPRNASRRTRSVQRSPMTESVRAIVQSSFPTSLQRTPRYSSKMELDARAGDNRLDSPGLLCYKRGMDTTRPPETLIEAVRYFANRDRALAFMAQVRW